MSKKPKREPVPTICPHIDFPFCELDDTRSLECEGKDYLGCELFSKWFWNRITSNVSVCTHIETLKKEDAK